MADTLCLRTTLRNVSGATRIFGWIPPHGQSLTDGQSITIFGDIFDQLLKGGRLCKRSQASLEDDLTNNRIEITKSPALFLYDSTDTNVKTVKVDSGTLGIADPCYGSYTGSP